MKKLTLILIIFFLPGMLSAERLSKDIRASRVLDLTHPMHENIPVWPGGKPFQKDRLVDYEKGYRYHVFSMGENVGTHIDAPSHFVKGRKSIDEIALEDLIAPIAKIDIQKQVQKNPSYQLSVKDIQLWERENGIIEEGSLVLLSTGWSKYFKNTKKYINQDEDGVMHFPGYSPEAASVLVDRDVVGIGIDTSSLDYGPSKDFQTHGVILKANKYQIENLTNLDQLPETGATAVVGVLPVREGSQAQARVLALLP